MDATQVGAGVVLLAASGVSLSAAGVPGGPVALALAAAGVVGVAVRSARERLLDR